MSNNSNESLLTGEDVLAGCVLSLTGIFGLLFYGSVAVALQQLGRTSTGFRFLFSQACAENLLFVQFGIWPGLLAFLQLDPFPISSRTYVQLYIDFAWFTTVWHYPLVAASRYCAIRAPVKFRDLTVRKTYLLCAVVWVLGLIQSASMRLFDWYVVFFYSPKTYGTISEDFIKYTSGGQKQYFMSTHIVLLTLSILFYACTGFALVRLKKPQTRSGATATTGTALPLHVHRHRYHNNNNNNDNKDNKNNQNSSANTLSDGGNNFESQNQSSAAFDSPLLDVRPVVAPSPSCGNVLMNKNGSLLDTAAENRPLHPARSAPALHAHVRKSSTRVPSQLRFSSLSAEKRLGLSCALHTLAFIIGQILITVGVASGKWVVFSIMCTFMCTALINPVLLLAMSPMLRTKYDAMWLQLYRRLCCRQKRMTHHGIGLVTTAELWSSLRIWSQMSLYSEKFLTGAPLRSKGRQNGNNKQANNSCADNPNIEIIPPSRASTVRQSQKEHKVDASAVEDDTATPAAQSAIVGVSPMEDSRVSFMLDNEDSELDSKIFVEEMV